MCVSVRERKEERGVKEADLQGSACVCVCVYNVGVRELVLSQHEQD